MILLIPSRKYLEPLLGLHTLLEYIYSAVPRPKDRHFYSNPELLI
jgi:hypothetical protein